MVMRASRTVVATTIAVLAVAAATAAGSPAGGHSVRSARTASVRPANAVIKPHSITGRLVKVGSLAGADITPGTLSAAALSPASIGQGLTLTGGVLGINPLSLDPFQRRVTGTPCPSGEAIGTISQSGAATCVPVGSGVTAITAGTGLNENQSVGNVTLGVDTPLSLSGESAAAIVQGSNSGTGAGGSFASTAGTGLLATGIERGIQATDSGDGGVGVYGLDSSSGGGYAGYFTSANGTGLFGSSVSGTGVYGFSQTGLAGVFAGSVAIEGSLDVVGAITAGVKDFKIDDPADPANKFLVHTSVESPDAENVYNGNVTTDRHGYATVRLPSYFDAENTDPRYQLTVIGSFARAIVWRTEHNNQFVIRTDKPRVMVSWQITGIRNDPFARSQRGPTEQLKPAVDRGRYLYPQGYGKSARFEIAR